MVLCLEDDTDDGVAIFVGTRPRMRDGSSYNQSWRDDLFCSLSVTHCSLSSLFTGVPASLMLGSCGSFDQNKMQSFLPPAESRVAHAFHAFCITTTGLPR